MCLFNGVSDLQEVAMHAKSSDLIQDHCDGDKVSFALTGLELEQGYREPYVQ